MLLRIIASVVGGAKQGRKILLLVCWSRYFGVESEEEWPRT